jgi:hypothetical protein
MNSAEPVRLRWSLFLSAIWTPVSRLHSLPALTRLLVKVIRLSVWLNACGLLPRESVLDDATWLNKRLEIRRDGAAPSAGVILGQLFK